MPPPNTDAQQQALHWATRLHSGDCSEAERRAFAAWLAQSEEHRAAYRQVEAFWRQLGGLWQEASPQLAAARAYLRQTRRPSRTRLKLAMALSLVTAIIAIPLAWPGLTAATYVTAKGEQRDIELADGSRITLNTDTRLRVRYGWAERTVWLERGEALFTVTHHAERPFEVIAAAGIIRDIGTRFDVRRTAERVSVAVLEGEVGVTTTANPMPQRLNPGDTLSYAADGRLPPMSHGDVEAMTAWTQGRLLFKGASLREVLDELSRYHAATVQAQDPRLLALKVSGSFPAHDLKLALATLSSALSVKVVALDGGRFRLER